MLFSRQRALSGKKYFIGSYNILLPKANGTGEFGEKLSGPFVPNKNEIATDTFISIGVLNTEDEAGGLLKYIKQNFLGAC